MDKSIKYDCFDCISRNNCPKFKAAKKAVFQAESLIEMKTICNEFKQLEYFITPFSLAVTSLLNCGLIENINDPKALEFWNDFVNQLGKCGYHLSL